MKLKKFLCVMVCTMIILSSLTLGVSAEVSFLNLVDNNAKVNPAWLEDLVIKEDISTIEGIKTETQLIPGREKTINQRYDDFSREFKNNLLLYSLDTTSQKNYYIEVLKLINDTAKSMGLLKSEAEMRDWLKSEHGIRFDTLDANTSLYTSILYVLLKTDFYSQFFNKQITIPYGTTLEGGIVLFLHGINEKAIDVPIESVKTVDQYSLEVTKAMLKKEGYTIKDGISSDEVYRLAAIHTLKKKGINADENLTLEELRLYYTASMLSERYGVTVKPEELQKALEKKSSEALVLRLMLEKKGKKSPSTATTFELFKLAVAEGYFPFEKKFYSDVDDYTINLKYKRGSIKIKAKAYAQRLIKNGDTVEMSFTRIVNGKEYTTALTNDAYKTLPLDSSKEREDVYINVVYNKGKSTERTAKYWLQINQGKTSPPNSTATTTKPSIGTTASTTDFFVDGDTGLTYYYGFDGVIDPIGLTQTKGSDESSSENESDTQQTDSKRWEMLNFLKRMLYIVVPILLAVGLVFANVLYKRKTGKLQTKPKKEK